MGRDMALWALCLACVVASAAPVWATQHEQEPDQLTLNTPLRIPQIKCSDSTKGCEVNIHLTTRVNLPPPMPLPVMVAQPGHADVPGVPDIDVDLQDLADVRANIFQVPYLPPIKLPGMSAFRINPASYTVSKSDLLAAMKAREKELLAARAYSLSRQQLQDDKRHFHSSSSQLFASSSSPPTTSSQSAGSASASSTMTQIPASFSSALSTAASQSTAGGSSSLQSMLASALSAAPAQSQQQQTQPRQSASATSAQMKSQQASQPQQPGSGASSGVGSAVETCESCVGSGRTWCRTKQKCYDSKSPELETCRRKSPPMKCGVSFVGGASSFQSS